MKFTHAAIGVLSVLNGSDAFFMARSLIKGVPTVATTNIVSMAGDRFSEDFLEALYPGKKDEGSSGEEEEDVGSGSSRFKDLLKASQQSGASGAQRIQHSIKNPFLNQPSSAIANPIQSLSSNPDELPVEEQARLFREMMAQQQADVSLSPPTYPPAEPQRVARTDRAGRPVGRNRDADTIANTADLYFAQLKRDSTVRTLARIRGESDVADRVFEDEGIKQLDDLLQKNPYLKGYVCVMLTESTGGAKDSSFFLHCFISLHFSQREKDMELIDEIPEEALAPFFKNNEPSEQEKSKSGPSYRQKLMERKFKQQEQRGAVSPFSGDNAALSGVSAPFGPSSDVQADPVAQHASIDEPTYSTLQQTPMVPQTSIAQHSSLVETDRSAVSPNPDDARQKIRTLMGLILKHRGGPGFGKGRLKGAEIVRFESLLQEVSALLREEAKNIQPLNTQLPSTIPATPSNDVVMPSSPQVQVSSSSDISPTVGVGASSANIDIDSTIACIEGAVTMYRNSPPELQKSVLVTLHAALLSAVGTCNTILAAYPPPAMAGNPDGRIDNTISVIEGAITMYKNSPPGLKESVLVTFRAALISAVETCSMVLGMQQQLSPPSAPAPPATEQTLRTTFPITETHPLSVAPSTAKDTMVFSEECSSAQSSSASGTDTNSKRLVEIFEKVKSAAGNGRLGLNSELLPSEAEALADELVEMRRILMNELELGVSQPESILQATSKEKSSTGTKYQEMLAKARAEKAGA
jgi:hypothetical protein